MDAAHCPSTVRPRAGSPTARRQGRQGRQGRRDKRVGLGRARRCHPKQRCPLVPIFLCAWLPRLITSHADAGPGQTTALTREASLHSTVGVDQHRSTLQDMLPCRGRGRRTARTAARLGVHSRRHLGSAAAESRTADPACQPDKAPPHRACPRSSRRPSRPATLRSGAGCRRLRRRGRTACSSSSHCIGSGETGE